MPKPRIRLAAPGVGLRWVCDNGLTAANGRCYGFGNSPLAAYNDWKEQFLVT